MHHENLLKSTNENTSSELVFLYDKAEKKVLFHNLPLTPFFESVTEEADPFFATSFDHELTKEWNTCLQLKEKETHDFTCKSILININPIHYNFHVLGITLPYSLYSSLLLFTITKVTTKETAPDYRKDYAELIDLAVHDMDAPLRKLSILTEKLAQKNKEYQGKEITGYMSRINANLADMRSIIDNLSTLFKIDLAVNEKNSCNTENILTEILHKNQQQLTEKNIKLSWTKLPVIIGNNSQVNLLFSHIIDNAIKFSKDEGGTIEIENSNLSGEEKIMFGLSASPYPYCKITVSDNGIGFPQEFSKKIFLPFVRLNGKSLYPGNGIGLAICKKIVETNNGIIYAEGEENIGARFILILPQTPG